MYVLCIYLSVSMYVGVKQTGSVNLASTKERLTVLRRQQAVGRCVTCSRHVCHML